VRFCFSTLFLLALASCTSEPTQPPPPPPPAQVATVGIEPPNLTLLPQQTAQLVAIIRDAAGNILVGRLINWSTSPADVATISSSGLVVALTPGAATVTATSEGRAGTATVSVVPAPVATVGVEPLNVTLLPQQSAQLVAIIRDAAGNILAGRLINWSTSPADVATISSSGLVVALAPGAATVTATSEGKGGTATISVVPATPGLTLVAGDDQIARPGEAYPILLQTVLRDGAGLPASNITVRYQGQGSATWVGGNGWPPHTDQQGSVAVRWYAPTNGTINFVVTATVEGATGFSPSAAQFHLAVTTRTLTIGNDTILALGDSLQLQARIDGLPASGVTWQSSVPTVATVDAAGKIRTLASGSTQITGTGQGLTATISITVVTPPSSTAAARIFSPRDFIAGRITIDIPATTAGRTLLFVVPGVTSLGWWGGAVGQPIPTTVSVQAIPSGPPTPGRAIARGTVLTRSEWSSPRTGPPQPLSSLRQFQVYSNTSQAYVPATGRLAYTGSRYAYYEDITNNINFDPNQYRVLDSIAAAYVPRLDALMGPPADLDGNGHILVFISQTVSSVRIGGEAYADGCNINVAGGACGDMGEIVYIVPPDHFGSWPSNAGFLVADYYPRNILHETIHILQYGHSYRRGGSYASWKAPAMIYEGLAEITRIDTRLGFQDAWNLLQTRFDNRDFSKTPFSDPYYMGAVLNWWLLRTWGEGYPQAMIESMFGAITAGQDLFENAVGVPEPDLLAIFYASLFFDDTPFGALFNLQFPGESVPSLVGGTNIPTQILAPGTTFSMPLSYTEGRVIDVRHSTMVRITIDAGPAGAAILVAQP